MSISAIVPVWNGRDLLARLLDSLAAQTVPAAELLVVDNGSTDGAPELAARRGARVIAMGRNAGFAPAVNRGIREARGEWVAVLNSDVVLAPDYFALLSATGAWFATGKLLMAGAPTCIDGTFDLVSRAATAWRAGNGQQDGPAFREPRRIWSAPWTAALFRAALFRKTGLLEESFESYLEDVDFGLRCARLGLAGEFLPAAVAWHQGSATLGRWHAATVRCIARNQLLLVARHYSTAAIWRNAWHIALGQALWGVLAFRHGAGAAWVRGKLDGIRRFRQSRGGMYDPALPLLLRQNEVAIRELQAAGCPENYWRLYFLLTTGGTK